MKKIFKKTTVLLCVIVFSFLPLFAEDETGFAGAVDGESAFAEQTDQEGQADQEVSVPAEETPAAAGPDTSRRDAGNIAQTIIDSIHNTVSNDTASDLQTKGFLVRFGLALGIIALQAFLIWLIWKLFRYLSEKVAETGEKKIKPLMLKKIKLLSTKQIISFIQLLLKILYYVVSGFLLFLTIPIVFSLFPATKNLASTLFGYILHPLRDIVIGTIKYIPNLFSIIIIIVLTRYALKALKFFTNQISKGRLVLPGFYADWAEPTFNILRVLVLAFTVALIYPYLPGSDSRVFQGVSVLVGVIFSLGSSTAIGNLVAGLVITYMRPFKIGDRVRIKEITGFVAEKNLMVIRLKTHKNEFVTFPNLMILNSSIINYTTSSDDRTDGLILNTEITFGYATPWEKIHEILIKAALSTDHVQKKPKPFVLQTGLDDFYARYQINCYTKEVDRVPAIYAQLYENIQIGFREAGIDMTAAHYEVSLQGQL